MQLLCPDLLNPEVGGYMASTVILGALEGVTKILFLARIELRFLGRPFCSQGPTAAALAETP